MMVKKKRQEHDEEKNADNIELSDNVYITEESKNQREDSNSDKTTKSKPAGNGDTDRIVAEQVNIEEKLAEMQDKYLRMSAEFDNYRKRTLREKIELTKYASENILSKIIPFMDDFERALKHMEDASDCESMKSGIDLIYDKFSGFLKQNGVTEIEAMNQPFNVDFHEAVAKVPVEDKEKKGKIMDVVSKGYFLQDKVLRFSKVVVGE